MVANSTKEVTVDRVSNSGNPIAKETHQGKTIHVPSGLKGETYEVRLRDRGSFVEASLVHRESGARAQRTVEPSGKTGSSKTLLDLGKELIGKESLTMEQRECSDNRLNSAEYPGKEHRSEIASRHD